MALLCWYAVLQALGWVALMVCAPRLAMLADRGHAMSKPLGVMLVSLVLWAGWSVGLLRNEAGGAWLGLLALGGVAAWRWQRGDLDDLFRELRDRRVFVVVSESLFALAFFGWALVRWRMPGLGHTEQPMDLALLSASATSATFPVLDPWLSGWSVSYYSFGHLMMSTLGHLAGTLPEVTYNVALATWFAFTVTVAHSIVAELSRSSRQRFRTSISGEVSSPTDLAEDRPAVVAGLLGATAVAVSGNGHFLAASAHYWWRGVAAPQPFWWWFGSARAASDTGFGGESIPLITEFPAFSFLLGDAHSHLLALPLVGVLCLLALAWLRASMQPGRAKSRERGPLPLCLLTVAALWMTSSWSVVGGSCSLAGVALIQARDFSSGMRKAVAVIAAAFGVTAVVTLPFALTGGPASRGVLPNLFGPTQPSELLLLFGMFLPGLVVGLLLAARELPIRTPDLAKGLGLGVTAAVTLVVAAIVALLRAPSGRDWPLNSSSQLLSAADLRREVLHRWLLNGWSVAVLVTILGVCLALVLGRWRAGSSSPMQPQPETVFVVVLSTVGVGLLLVPELVLIRDAFDSRMNTVFKFHHQAWLFLGAVAAWGTARAVKKSAPPWHRLGGVVSVFGLVSGLIYLPVALAARDRETRAASSASASPSDRGREFGLDGLVGVPSDELAAIRWLRANTPPDSVVVLAEGNSYQGSQSRLASASGRATLLGWQGHELQWRGESYGALTMGRREALASIYGAGDEDAESFRATLDRWKVDYVALTANERSLYVMGTEDVKALERMLEPAFVSGDITIFRRAALRGAP